MTDAAITLAASDVRRFQSLYKARFGIDIDDEQAAHKLNQLVRQMQAVYRPIRAAQVARLQDVDVYGDKRVEKKKQ